MSADGNGRVIPLRAREHGEALPPAELSAKLQQLTAAVKTDPLSWAVEILRIVAKNPRPPEIERTGVPKYLEKAQPWIQVAAQKAYVRGEAERDLRASMRAEVIFREHSEKQHAATLAKYHAERWHVAAVSDDMQVREEQLRAALDRRYGR